MSQKQWDTLSSLTRCRGNLLRQHDHIVSLLHRETIFWDSLFLF
ncbi:hypothetical protein B4109_0015 [Geobacillus stearothermophilus]|uniref:Uncharacterized protein n=1 Tax=Geobacillus stearothermophilus TaxID=1422 RepID=A0A150NBM4_GEOSE|nr:hypothetical protein B4109_0015 [Geobacillus stearothermophilus]KYD34078.1 hypothetical protein B4114_0006 [Geobacillus stearothermophilus]